MADNVTVINRSFGDIWKALDMREQRKALRGAMRREGRRLHAMAASELRASGIGQGTNQPLAKGIRPRVFPDKYGAGFMLTVKPNGKKGFHTNRQGKQKPVLMWAEDGTKLRRTKTKTKFFVRKRKGHITGRMRRYGFMAMTEQQATKSVEENLFRDFEANLEKAARKRGLL